MSIEGSAKSLKILVYLHYEVKKELPYMIGMIRLTDP